MFLSLTSIALLLYKISNFKKKLTLRNNEFKSYEFFTMNFFYGKKIYIATNFIL